MQGLCYPLHEMSTGRTKRMSEDGALFTASSSRGGDTREPVSEITRGPRSLARCTHESPTKQDMACARCWEVDKIQPHPFCSSFTRTLRSAEEAPSDPPFTAQEASSERFLPRLGAA